MKRILSFLFCLLALSAGAATYYVRPGGTGAGSDWSSALGALPTTISTANATYYVAAGTYAVNKTITISGSGVTIKAANAADCSGVAGWSSSYVGQALLDVCHIIINANNVTLDGVTGGGPGSWTTGYGIKLRTGRGNTTPYINPAVQVGAGNSSPVANTVIKHLEIEGDHGDAPSSGSGNDGVQAYQNQTPGLVSYCYIHDMGRCLMTTRSSNWTFEYICGGTYEYDISNEHSEILVADCWDDLSTPSSCYRTGIIVRNSLFLSCLGTGGLMFQCNGADIYGNVFYNSKANPSWWDYCWAGALGSHDSGSGLVNIRIYNNTFIDATAVANTICGSGSDQSIGTILGIYFSGNGNPACANNSFYNNLLVGNSDPGFQWWGFTGTHDYNAYVNLTKGKSFSESHGKMLTLASYPFVDAANYDFRLTTNITGTPLASPYYNTDPSGNARSTWTVGAYEFGVASRGTVPLPPQNLRVAGH